MSGEKTTVHLLRHGEVYNPDGILYGRLPGFKLSDLGHEMALAAAEHLAGRDISHVVASPLVRAQQTAEPIAASHRIETDTDEDLIESDNFFEGKRVSVGDGVLRNPKFWWQLRDPFTPSWGEPYVVIARRMMHAVTRAREAATGHEAVLVSHQLPIWTLRRFVERERLYHDPRRRECGLASLTSLSFVGNTLVDVDYVEPAAHLVLKSSTAKNAKGA